MFCRFRHSFLALAFIASACSGPAETAPKARAAEAEPGWTIAPEGDLNGFFDCLAAEGASIISAHRGGPYPGYPENALETMAAILEKIPAIMEVDVATSSDGVLYLMHDDRLERTTTGEGEANALPWRAIQNLRLVDDEGEKTPFSPTRFDKVLAWAKGRTILQIDFKPMTKYEDVASEIIHQQAEDRVLLIARTLPQAEKLHRLLPNTMISLNVNSQSELNEAVARGVPADRLMGFTGTHDPRPRLFSVLSGRNVEVIFGTLGGSDSIDNDIAMTGDAARYAALAAQGVDIIATDRPLEANAALAAAGSAPQAGECGINLG